MHRVICQHHGGSAKSASEDLEGHAEALAARAQRPFRYVPSARMSKEDVVREIRRSDPVTTGLICILSWVEPCQSFTIRRDRASRHVHLVSQERKCLHLYFYYLDAEFGLMHVRLQTWLPCAIQVYVTAASGWRAR